jgi:tetratricopeptide (TPR) repeat protein
VTVYTSRDVAEIVGLKESRVRYWAQTGFVGPSQRLRGKAVYSFGDLVGVRTAKELLDRGVTLQHARKSLDALRTQLPQVDRPLAQLRVVSDGEKLVVTGDAPYEPLSGQLVMSFEVGELAGRAAAVLRLDEARREAPLERADTAYAWFVEGVRLDADPERSDEALIAYQKALEADPRLAAAYTNMGRLLCARGEVGEARAAYGRALELDPEQPEARYNLANLLDDVGEHDQAIAEWQRVLAGCPEFADAHFNLASAYLQRGASSAAKHHLVRYLELDESSEWAGQARTLLASL